MQSKLRPCAAQLYCSLITLIAANPGVFFELFFLALRQREKAETRFLNAQLFLQLCTRIQPRPPVTANSTIVRTLILDSFDCPSSGARYRRNRKKRTRFFCVNSGVFLTGFFWTRKFFLQLCLRTQPCLPVTAKQYYIEDA